MFISSDHGFPEKQQNVSTFVKCIYTSKYRSGVSHDAGVYIIISELLNRGYVERNKCENQFTF